MTIIRLSVDGFPQQTLLLSDTSILASPQACLNDACINGCAALLYSAFLPAAASCAVLSTHDLPHIRYNVAMPMMKPSGAMCHGLASGRSPFGCFQFIVHCPWDIGCSAQFIFQVGSCCCSTAWLNSSLGGRMLRSATFVH